MISILPAILSKTFDEVRAKVALVPNARLIQLDVVDGLFAPEKSWPYLEDKIDDISLVDSLPGDAQFEIHLMVNNPEEIAGVWASCARVKRVIFHIEGTTNAAVVISEVKSKKKEVGIALKLAAPIEIISEYVKDIDTVLLMSIAHIGSHGVPFELAVYEKIKAVRAQYPDLVVGVDGGVNESNIPQLVESGATILIVGSAVFLPADPQEALNSLKSFV